MRTPCLVVIALGLTGCSGWYRSGRFQPIAEAAAVHASGCPAVSTTALHWWAFQIDDACGHTAYYRCWYKRHGQGTQCCRRVESEHDAAKLLIASLDHPGGAYPETTVCWN